MRLPLYQHNGQSLSNGNNAADHCNNEHPGLRFDKFPEWQDNPRHSLDEKAKPEFLKQFTSTRKFEYLNGALEKYHQRRGKLLKATCGIESRLSTDWRLISGLGSGHPYETGMIWHRTLGVPYLPGSSIKGVLRSWLIQWEEDESLAFELFGNESETKTPRPGKLIILDAIPDSVPKLELDILNPHYQPYYSDPANPPADYYNPIPVYFLTVAPKQSFVFQIAPRLAAYSGYAGIERKQQIEVDMKQGKEILTVALGTIGAGGKTAVGYGLFTRKTTERNGDSETWENANLRKISERGSGDVLQATIPGKKASAKWQDIQSQINALGLSKAKSKRLGKLAGITQSVVVTRKGNTYKVTAIDSN